MPCTSIHVFLISYCWQAGNTLKSLTSNVAAIMKC